MPKVLRINDLKRLNEIIIKNDNRLLMPVNDGNGDLVIGSEVLDDPSYEKVHKIIQEITEEIEYVPFPEDLTLINQKINEITLDGKLIKMDSAAQIDYGGLKIIVQDESDVKEPDPIIKKT